MRAFTSATGTTNTAKSRRRTRMTTRTPVRTAISQYFSLAKIHMQTSGDTTAAPVALFLMHFSLLVEHYLKSYCEKLTSLWRKFWVLRSAEY